VGILLRVMADPGKEPTQELVQGVRADSVAALIVVGVQGGKKGVLIIVSERGALEPESLA